MTIRLNQRFGRLVIVRRIGLTPSRRNSVWLCRCDCGKEKCIRADWLVSEQVRSCGCWREGRKGRHLNKGRYALKVVWRNMLYRCYSPGFKVYENYGGRGIRVCDRWRQSFEAFKKDMGEPPTGMSLNRKDNDKDYCPDNCEWASLKVQARNKTNTRWIVIDGVKKSVAEWGEINGVNRHTIITRLRAGWDEKRAVTLKVCKITNKQ